MKFSAPSPLVFWNKARLFAECKMDMCLIGACLGLLGILGNAIRGLGAPVRDDGRVPASRCPLGSLSNNSLASNPSCEDSGHVLE